MLRWSHCFVVLYYLTSKYNKVFVSLGKHFRLGKLAASGRLYIDRCRLRGGGILTRKENTPDKTQVRVDVVGYLH